jgi:hypothetical protein
VVTYIPDFSPGSVNVETLPGDIDLSGYHDVVDVAEVINMIFRGAAAPVPPDRLDANCDGTYTIQDVVKVVDFAFRGIIAAYCP